MKKNLFDLTTPQKTIILTEQYYAGSNINNIGGSISFDEKLNFDLLEKAINLVIEHNSSFQIKLCLDGNEIKQYFSDYEPYSIELVDVTSQDDILKLEYDVMHKTFDIYKSLFVFKLFRLPNGTGGYIINTHHIISDSWTIGLIITEIARVYSSLIKDEEPEFNSIPAYIDCILDEQNYKNSDKFLKDKEYWNSIFETLPSPVSFPSRKQQNQFSCKANRINYTISKDEMNKISDFCKKINVSVFNFFMGIFAIYAGKVSGLDDFVIGTPILGRTNFKEKNTAGMFINVLPVRFDMTKNLSFSEFESTIAKNSIGMLRHQKYSNQFIIEDLRRSDPSLPSLYNMVVSYQITKTVDRNYIACNSRWGFNGNTVEDVEIHIYDLNDTGSVNVSYDYRVDKYDEEDIANVHNRILHMIHQVVNNEQIGIHDIEIVTSKEKNDILYTFNNTATKYPKDKTVIQLFEEQVKNNPNGIVVIFEDKKLTYKELNEKANRLAHYLVNSGVKSNDIVSIMLNRSVETIISMLAVLKANAAYMLIDTNLPEDRILYMINNANSNLLITTSDIKNINFNNKVFIDNEKLNTFNTDNLNLNYDINNNLSVVYTSGSTGKPKGVLLRQQGMINLMFCYKGFIDIDNFSNFISICSISFDMFAVEIYIPLLNGKVLVLSNEEEHKDPISISKLIKSNNVEFMMITPSKIQLLLDNDYTVDCLQNLKSIQLGGEVFTSSLYENLKKHTNAQLCNEYGPSEITSCCSYKEITSANNINIGGPINNVQIYILNKDMNLCPIGIDGEICVGGDGISKGYINNPTATDKAFVKNPFGDGLLYKTGDIGKYNANGEIEYVGRKDFQVKLRGLRIELSEIEKQLANVENVKHCAVIFKQPTDNDSYLAAFYTSDKDIDISFIRTELSKHLPLYMVPKYFIKLDNMPITRNGKIDLKALQEYKITTTKKSDYTAPENELQKLFCDVWSKLLNTKVGITDDVFELGADSLLAIKFKVELLSHNIEIEYANIFKYTIIKDFYNNCSSVNTHATVIQKAKKQEYYPVSSAQKRIYYASSLENNSLAYNIAGGVILDKTPDVAKLENCFNTIVNRHESLRTYFDVIDGDIVQKVLDKFDFKLEVENSNSNDLDKLFNDFVKPFNLNKAPLFNAKLINLSNSKSFLLLNMHHIISDGTSFSILMDEICKLYNNSNDLPELDISYKDFAVWENDKLNSDEFNKDKEFWVNQFSDEIPLLNMPTNYTRPTMQSFEGDNIFASIDSNLTLKLNELSKNLGITPYMLLLSAYYILLYKYTSQEDIIIGSPIVGRDNLQLSNIIGMFVNSLALRNKIDSSMSFKDFVNTVKVNCLEGFGHQTYPFDELVKALDIKRDTSRNPLFDTMFVYQNDGNANASFDGINSKTYAPKSNIAKFDLSLEVIPENGKLNLLFEYCTKLFNKDFITKLSKHYINILQAVIEDSNIQIANIDMLCEEEKHQILYDFNNTKANYPKDKTIIQLFEEQANKNPDGIAVIFEDKKLTYKELNEKANRLAHYLVNSGVKNNDIVGIMLDRSFETIISMLAVLKANAAYMLIDINLPEDRILYMLNNANSNLLITTSDIKNIDFNNKVFIDKENLSTFNTDNLNLNYNINNTFCIIYTSGSTGTPKGVELRNKGVINLILGHKLCMNTDICNVFISISTVAFDMFIVETYVPLLSGKTVILSNSEEQKIPTSISHLIKKYNVDFILTTPSRIELLLINDNTKECLKNLKLIQLGGEVFTENLYNKLHEYTNANIYNGYGPSEFTACCACKFINSNNINIGKPICNTNIYILNNDMNLCPIGIDGEICVGGDGISKGYINNPTATDKAFVKNPFGDGLLYKTGDIGKYNSDGEIEYIGRRDFQIKMRGLRIELSEIEKRLANIEDIKKCAVIFKQQTDNDSYLVAFYTSDKDIDISFIRTELSKHLPLYMVPKYFIKLDNMPITRNGKIDLKVLKEYEITNVESLNYVAPENELQKLFCDIWEKLLNTKVGITDNVFELGADSLLAIKFKVELLSHNIEIEYANIFKYPTVKDFYNNCSSVNTHISIIPKIKKQDYYPVSSAQRRMYYASSLDTDSLLYNIAGGVILDKTPDISKLENCFNTIVNRHESLRTYFDVIDGDIVQKILDKFDFKLEVENSNSNDLDKLFNDFVKPFNLNKAPLFSAKLINLSNSKSFLLLNMHHIISDGTSFSILMNEICKLYNDSNDLPKLDITYKDFAVWENNKLNSDEFNKDKEFWVNQFSDEIPLLNMPTNYPRPTVQSFEGDNIFASIDSNLTLKLNELSKNLGITPYMLLLSAYYILLYKYTSQEDIIIGSPIVGRDNLQLSNIIGMFVNSLALRNKIDSSMSFKDFANSVKANCLEAFGHQTYPFDELVKALDIKRDTSRNPLFDTMFVYQNDGNANVNFDGIKSEVYVPKSNVAKFDLSLEIIPENGKLNLLFEYCTKLFNKDFITKLSKHYINILQAVIEDSNIQIANIDMLCEEEKHQILYDFNNTKANYPKDKTVIQLFEEQANKNPDGVAVIFEDKKLTYKELNEKANRLAHYLINNGVKNNDIISVCMNKNISFIITILGVLKCGCAYLPINPTYPINRINYIVQNSKSKLFITDTNFDTESTTTLNIDNINYSKYDKTNLKINISTDDLAYIIYTSGSTGNPKGVMVTHNNLVNFLFSFNNCFNNKFGSKDSCLSLTNISFDVSVCEIFTPLAFGCTLVLYPEDTLTSIPLLCDMLNKFKVTFLYIPPSVLNDVSSYIVSNNIKVYINKLLVGVEAIKNSTLNKFLEINKDMEIINGYGPTEATICTTFYKYKFSDNLNENVPIGFPISNSKIFILDKDTNLLPIGVVGELCISGDNVSKGYLNSSELTKKAFVNNDKYSSTTIYKTGDLAFWTENGILSFIGRNDSQIKFKGHRIELNEINSTLRNISNITNSYTMIRKVNNIDCICSFITANTDVDLEYINNYLKKNLPYYMIPSHVVLLDAFPVTLNGKIDSKVLKEYKITTSKKSNYVAPENELQKLFCDVWEKLLNTKVGIDDDIFELGADSLLAIKFKVEMLSNNVNVEYADIFKYHTVRELSEAKAIDESENTYDYTKINNILEKNNIKNCKKILTNKNNHVLLLGSNGFVGMHILYNFIKNDNGKIYCIVRDKNKLSARTRFLDALHFYFNDELDEFLDNRIVIFKGDITKENFGLSNELYNEIVDDVSIVINSSANVRHYGNFKSFEDINIGLTEKAIEFCEKYNKRLIQISSVSVSGEIDKNEVMTFSENNLYIGQKLDNVYVKSKFEAERIILEHVASGLNAQILRLGNITNRYSDGKFQINPDENAFIGRIQSLIKLGVIPDYLLNAKLEFTPVDLCGFAIVAIMQNYIPDFSVFHLYNDSYIVMKDFIEILKKYNIHLKVVNYAEFDKIIKETLLDDNKKDILSGIINELNLNNNIEINSNINILSEFSKMFLYKIGFNWLNIDNKYMEKYIKYFKYIKFI